MGEPAADMVGAIVNAGKTAWDIVKDNKAQSGAASSFCSAVPENLKFTELSGWKTKTGTWKYQIENLYGGDCVEIDLVYSFDWGGTSDKVKDAVFVNNFTVYAKSATALWGYSADVNATVKGNPLNVGSSKAIVGAIPLLVTASVSTVLKAGSTTWLMRARGDGKLEVSS
jgi:hypothetical protein